LFFCRIFSLIQKPIGGNSQKGFDFIQVHPLSRRVKIKSAWQFFVAFFWDVCSKVTRNQRGIMTFPKIEGIESNRIYSVWVTHVTHRGEKSPGATLEIWVVATQIFFHFYPENWGR